MVTLQIEDHLLVGEELKYIDHHSEKVYHMKSNILLSKNNYLDLNLHGT